MTQERYFTVPYPVAVLSVLWVLVAGMFGTAVAMGLLYLGGLALMLSGVASAFTVIHAVRMIAARVGGGVVDEVDQRLRLRRAVIAGEVAAEVVRQMELKALEQQVAHLVPTPRES